MLQAVYCNDSVTLNQLKGLRGSGKSVSFWQLVEGHSGNCSECEMRLRFCE